MGSYFSRLIYGEDSITEEDIALEYSSDEAILLTDETFDDESVNT